MLKFWLGMVALVGVLYFGVNYNGWLKRTRGCSAFTFWRVIGGIIDLFLWGATLSADSPAHGIILFFISSAIFLILFFVNYKDSKSVLHGFLMTLWLLLIGGLIMQLLDSVRKWLKER